MAVNYSRFIVETVKADKNFSLNSIHVNESQRNQVFDSSDSEGSERILKAELRNNDFRLVYTAKKDFRFKSRASNARNTNEAANIDLSHFTE